MKDKVARQAPPRQRLGRADDGLGPNTDIGARLRALYGSVQNEGIPDKLLDLLERLDSVEQAAKSNARAK